MKIPEKHLKIVFLAQQDFSCKNNAAKILSAIASKFSSKIYIKTNENITCNLKSIISFLDLKIKANQEVEIIIFGKDAKLAKSVLLKTLALIDNKSNKLKSKAISQKVK